jgi:hypothetical protein
MTTATKMPERWVTGIRRQPGFIDGPDEALWHAHRDAGKPADITTFRLGFEGGMREGERKSPLLADVVAELQKAHRIIYLQRMQMGPQGKTLYARNAHAAGLIGDDDTRETERAAVLARAGAPL